MTAYSFQEFMQEFGRAYEVGSGEYTRRMAVFEDSMARIVSLNNRVGPSYTAGVHPFMDWTQEERRTLYGYKPSTSRSAFAALQTNSSFSDYSMDELAEDYAAEGPPIREQGNCGSCWAISAVEAMEAQLMKSGNNDVRLSAQAFVDCVPNPQHCGGAGGCDGATGELAYAFARDHGIPMDSNLPYTKKTGECAMNPETKAAYPAMQRARVSGWTNLPSNQAKPLMQALVQQGPAVVAVDSDPWFEYARGVFDDCDDHWELGHAVLAKGYGKDGDRKYWLIQNSWGRRWGENGNIRLLRHDDDDQRCGTDKKPQEGQGCDGGPKEITVCGTCGMLYDAFFPNGVRLEDGDSSSMDSAQPTVVNSAPTEAPDGAGSEPTPEAQATTTQSPVAAMAVATQASAAADAALEPAAPAEAPAQDAGLPQQSDAPQAPAATKPAAAAGSSPVDQMKALFGQQ